MHRAVASLVYACAYDPMQHGHIFKSINSCDNAYGFVDTYRNISCSKNSCDYLFLQVITSFICIENRDNAGTLQGLCGVHVIARSYVGRQSSKQRGIATSSCQALHEQLAQLGTRHGRCAGSSGRTRKNLLHSQTHSANRWSRQ